MFMKNSVLLCSIILFCVGLTSCKKSITSDEEDTFNSLTDSEFISEISGTWKVIGADLSGESPEKSGKEYHIPHTYDTKLSHIITTSDNMTFYFKEPIRLVLKVPDENYDTDTNPYSYKEIVTNTSEYSFPFKKFSGVICFPGNYNVDDNNAEYIEAFKGGNMEKIQSASSYMQYFFYSRDDEHACRLFLKLPGSSLIIFEFIR